LLISEFATTDAQGHLTVVNVFNRLAGPGPRWGLPVIYLSVIIEAHPQEAGTSHDLEIRLIDSERKTVLPDAFRSKVTFVEPAGALPGMPVRHITTAGIFGARFSKPGPYAFEAYIDGIYSGSATLYVSQTEVRG